MDAGGAGGREVPGLNRAGGGRPAAAPRGAGGVMGFMRPRQKKPRGNGANTARREVGIGTDLRLVGGATPRSDLDRMEEEGEAGAREGRGRRWRRRGGEQRRRRKNPERGRRAGFLWRAERRGSARRQRVGALRHKESNGGEERSKSIERLRTRQNRRRAKLKEDLTDGKESSRRSDGAWKRGNVA